MASKRKSKKQTKPRAPSITCRWQRFVAVGCNHGQMVSHHAVTAVSRFMDDYDPQVRIHLGDCWDTTAFRRGAKGTGDESADVDADFRAGERFLEWFRPTLFFIGNHEDRLYSFLDSPDARVAWAAQQCIKRMTDAVQGAEIVPYDIFHGWREIGGTVWGHGYMYNIAAIRDHAESTGKDTVIAHLHRTGIEQARGLSGATGYCVGWLGNADHAGYAARRRQTLGWRNGFAWGEVCQDSASINVHTHAERDTAWRLPKVK